MTTAFSMVLRYLIAMAVCGDLTLFPTLFSIPRLLHSPHLGARQAVCRYGVQDALRAAQLLQARQGGGQVIVIASGGSFFSIVAVPYTTNIIVYNWLTNQRINLDLAIATPRQSRRANRKRRPPPLCNFWKRRDSS